MDWKHLHFIWKQFLSASYLPNIIYSNTLKNLLKEKYIYDGTNDSFISITSKYIPVHSDFIKFWENTITITNTESSNTDLIFNNELEIDELSSLFKVWCKQMNSQIMTNGNISEDNILKILIHFFPNIEIIEEKYVLNVSSNMWNKISDIDKAFGYIIEQIKLDSKLDSKLILISFDDAYNYYYKFCNINSLKFIVSKRYFEKYLYYKLSDHIVYEKFIEVSCL